MITSLELFITTAALAILSALLSLVLGYPVGLWLGQIGAAARRLIGALLVVPFLLPPLLIGIALLPITQGLKIDSTSGMAFILLAHTLMNAGFIARITASSAIPPEQIEAARIDGASDRKIRRLVEFPQQIPALVSGGLLVGLYSATSYGLVLLIGGGTVKTLETEIAESVLQRLDLATGALLAGLQTLLTLGLFWVTKRFSATGFTLDQVGSSALKVGVTAKAIGALFTFSVIYLLTQVLFRAVESVDNFSNLFSTGTRQLLNISVIEAAGNSLRNMLVVLVISVPAAVWLGGRRHASFLALLPVGISPVVIGLTALVLSGYLPREMSSSWLVVPVVQSLIAIPLGYQILRPARRAIDQELRDAARLDGAGYLVALFRVELPMLQKPILTAIAFVALSSLGEFGAASFLAFGNQETLPMVMFRLAARPGGDNFGMAMAAGAIYILLTAWIVWIISSSEKTERQVSLGEH